MEEIPSHRQVGVLIGIKECYTNLFCLSVSPHRYNLVPVTQDFHSWEPAEDVIGDRS